MSTDIGPEDRAITDLENDENFGDEPIDKADVDDDDDEEDNWDDDDDDWDDDP